VHERAVPWCLTLALATEPAVLRLVRKLLAELVRIAGGSDSEADDVELAAGEVLANAYQHAYAQGAGPVLVEIAFAPPALQLLIRDDGAPLLSRPTIPLSPPAGRSGRGLYMVGQLMDEVEVIHPCRGNRGTAVRVVKQLTGTPRSKRRSSA